jgi:tRNA threonylcarbamoyladenosine biosynthesis protein TsaE
MNRFVFNAASEADTEVLGAALADALPERAVVALIGTLGAGKTRLVQALAAACGVPRQSVVSPTFVLANEYRGRRTIHHLDAYRLRDEEEFLALGAEEYFASDAIMLLEWADRVESCLPRDRLEIRIEETGPTTRRFEITAIGEKYQPTVERLAAWDSSNSKGERSA